MYALNTKCNGNNWCLGLSAKLSEPRSRLVLEEKEFGKQRREQLNLQSHRGGKGHKDSVGKRYSSWWKGEWDLTGRLDDQESCSRQGEQPEQGHRDQKSWYLHAQY